MATAELSAPPGDPSCPIKGMYRLFDLITGQESSEPADRIVIAHESLQAFINALSPGAYSSITKINFKILDDLLLKPIGIYGSREEIVRFLREMGIIDVNMDSEHILRSGLYTTCSFKSTTEVQTYVVYWPEDTTWNDTAASSVQRNRTIFMRYLTKLCDQIICLISTGHSEAIVWGDELRRRDSENDESDRLFDFTLAETNKQEDNVVVRQGFTMTSPHLVAPPPQPNVQVDAGLLSPRLLCGEKTQGFMTTNSLLVKVSVEHFFRDHQSASQIRHLLEDGAVLCLSKTLDDKALKTLMDLGLGTRFAKEYEAWGKRRIEILAKRFRGTLTQRQAEILINLEENPRDIQANVREAVISEILKALPKLRREGFSSESQPGVIDSGEAAGTIQDLFSIYPKAASMFRGSIRAAKLYKGIKGTDFELKKERILVLHYFVDNYKSLNAKQIRSLGDAVLVSGDKQKTLDILKSFSKEERRSPFYFSGILGGRPETTRFTLPKEAKEEKMWRNAHKYAWEIDHVRFLSYLKTIPATGFLYDAAVECEKTAYDCLTKQLDSLVSGISEHILSIHGEECAKQIQRDKDEEEMELETSRAEFVQKIEYFCQEHSRSRNRTYIDNFAAKKEDEHAPDSYLIGGRRESWQCPEIEYNIHILRFVVHEESNPILVPNEELSQTFHVPSEMVVKYAHLLEGSRILLSLVDSDGNVTIFLDRLDRIDRTIQSRSHVKVLPQDKIGKTCLFVFDESRRMLAIYASAKLQLHMFVFDEEFKSLRGLGTPFDLLPFYIPGVFITHACFVHGSEEILLIDSSAQARVFSLITLQPKPASLQLPQTPGAIYSSPDGSCILTVQEEGGKRSITAYHWSTFASNRGISVTLPDFPVDLEAALLTSVVNQNNIHLIGLDMSSLSCRSVVLDITLKATEFTFQERGPKVLSRRRKQTAHNCLIDCHRDVWTHFPVVAAAVKRHAITSSSQREQKTLVFVTDDDRRPFSSHFSDMISAFEKTSCMPTGDKLKSIEVSTRNLPGIIQRLLSNPDWTASRFRAGEWLADLLCLMPIRIAIAHENRVVPLKDGVVSSELEKSLLEAEVNRIIDSLSLGWYESIFQSYWVSKPVKVVSSMGEQYVGKKITLNQFLDTSFVGSAMPTTEGVWMSVTPTEDAIIVALDFEGVHNLRHSAQEDTLLVLFMTAISNLVLLHNNFASNRDMTSLFQSFQSGSSILDPASDASLFQSTLVVIVKDVIDSDKAEVTRDFALKFQKVAQEEKDANFITRLHAGKVQIIPWPVIRSREYFKPFSALKKKLDKQIISHNTAGEFLLTLKTLMAKLKAIEWGAISQTMAAHRVHSLLAILPIALETGYSEVLVELEPLKGFDTDLVIEAEDTEARFLLPGPNTPTADREQHLSTLIESWDRSGSRQQIVDPEWISNLEQHLTHLVDLRVAHVDKWLKSNTQRFQEENANMDELRRAFNSAVIDLRASIQLCKSECDDCILLCIRNRSHEGCHDCLTSHDCIHDCIFCETQMSSKKHCGQLSGHSGDHVCYVGVHLCGKPCKLSGKIGCADECVKLVEHEGDHICSAPVHTCDQPCGLIELKLPDGKSFTCPRKCHVPINREHTVHECDSGICPISCNLCKRLCSGNHLHGLVRGENHLCGQEHSCTALCSAPGICQVATTPKSRDATSTRWYEAFQYTQTAKRLRCVKIIKQGEVEHEGSHTHSNEKQPLHYCESQCVSCGNFCTLPLGHYQQEHETSHGFTSHTPWVIDSPEGNITELDKHKFPAKDDGAPMLCNLACISIGRHVHIDSCHGEPHDDPQVQHIKERLVPNPDQAKDWITHDLYWRRMGFKDPCPRSDQANFAKCDAMCPGCEHTVEVGGAEVRPSHCTLPMFHPVMDAANVPAGIGYVSSDGHHFNCSNPVLMQQAFHVIFVIDRSRSMSQTDRRPPHDSARVDRIMQKANNRLGVVFSALYSFWVARQAALNSGSSLGAGTRDAYSLIFFNHESSTPIENDSTSSPDELLTAALHYEADGGKNFTGALERTYNVMNSHWNMERPPVVIFLSDDEDNVSDEVIYDICGSAVRHGRPLLFHAISFGQGSAFYPLFRMVQIALGAQKMAQAALDAQKNAPDNPLQPAAAIALSSYFVAYDTDGLVNTFLGIAESLITPRVP
ncbi:hypothetical protein V8E53_005933 [Lactarius tabidus]